MIKQYQKIKNNIEHKIAQWVLKKSGIDWGDLSTHFSRINGHSSGYSSSQDYLNAYEIATLLGTLCDIVATHISSLPWEIQDKNGKAISSKKFDEFMANPGDNITAKELIEYSILHIILEGNIFWMLRQPNMLNVSNGTYTISPLNPALVDVYSSSGLCVESSTKINALGIGRYHVQVENGTLIDVSPKDMIHVRSLGPHNRIRGLGRVQQNKTVLEDDRMSTIFSQMFFKNGANVSLIVTPEKDISPIAYKEYSQKLRDVHEGANNIGKMFVSPFAGSVSPGNLSQNDMQYIEQKNFTVDQICNIIQVPSIFLSGSKTKYDSSDGQVKAFFNSTLPRYGGFIESALTRVLQLLEKRTDIVFKTQYPNVNKVEEASNLFDRGVITGNEYRTIFGVSPDESDDRLNQRFMTMQYVPMDYILGTQILPSEQPQKLQESQQQDSAPVKKNIGKKKFTRESQYHIHKQATIIKRQCEKRITKDVKAFYEGMQARIMDKIKSSPTLSTKATDDPFDIKEEINNAKNASKAMYTASITLSMNELNRILETEIDSSTKNKFVRLVVEKLSTRYAIQTMNSRYEELRVLFGTAQEQGQSISEVAGSLNEYFNELSGENAWKATRIARTEAFYAWDQAAVNAYNEIGVTIVDVIGCDDEHGDCNRQNIPISEAWDLDLHPNHTGTIVPQV